MKKPLIAIIALVYLITSSGVAFSIHYCMGKLASVDLMHTNEKCSKCGMKKDGGCCKDEFRIVKLSDSHKIITNDIRIFSPVSLFDNFNADVTPVITTTSFKPVFNNHSPPGSPVPLNILYRVFRI